MIKVSVVSFFRGHAAAYHLRFKSIFELLRLEGKIKYREIVKVIFGKYRRIAFDKNADLMFIGRTRDVYLLKRIFDCTAKFSIPVIYETDDLILFGRRKDTPIKNHDEVAGYLKKADGILTSTEYLADELKKYNSRVFTFPNLLDPNIWDVNIDKKVSNSKQIKICCIGTGMMPENLQYILQAIGKCNRLYSRDVIFYLWGNKKYIDANIRGLKNIVVIGKKVPYKKYAKALQKSDFDFAVVPLSDSHFNRAKSSIKYLEYGISRIPALFSKVKPYENLPDGESCILVENNPDAWCKEIIEMIENKELRYCLSQQVFNDVKNNYLLNKEQAGKYLSILESLCVSRP